MTGPTYRGHRLLAGVEEFHAAVDQLQADTRPLSYAQKVWASQYEREQASRGRRGRPPRYRGARTTRQQVD